MIKRLVISAAKQAEFEEVPVPDCPPDGVLVRARITAISTGTELRVFRAIPVDREGRFLHEQVPFHLPAENGYSMVGEIVAVGPRVQGVAIGDRVFAGAAHREIAALPAGRVVKLPDAVPDEEAVFLNILEVSHRALRQAGSTPGEDVAIVGQGVIGLAALAYCHAFGFRTAVVDSEPARLEIARAMGAHLAVSPAEPGFVRRIVELFDGQGADVVYEAASNWDAIHTAMELARTDGKVIVVSRHTDQPHFNPVGHPFLGKRLRLITTYGYPPQGHRWDQRRSVSLTLDLLATGKLSMRPAITHHLDWQEIPEFYRRLDQGDRSIVGAVIRW